MLYQWHGINFGSVGRVASNQHHVTHSEPGLHCLSLSQTPSSCPSLDSFWLVISLEIVFLTNISPSASTRCLDAQAIPFTHADCAFPTNINFSCLGHIGCVSILLASLLDPSVTPKSSWRTTFYAIWRASSPLLVRLRIAMSG